MPLESLEIAVVVVNYGTPGLALEAVGSVIERDHGGRGVEVHLVDNASPGDDAEILAQAITERGWVDRVQFYPETRNLGFGVGNNVVLDALAGRTNRPDKVFLLNPDARLDNEAIDLLAQALDNAPGAGCVGAGLLDPDGTPTTAAFRFPGLAGEFAEALSFNPVSQLLDRWRIPLPPEHPSGTVDWVTGAAVMFRFEALLQSGFFDPGFFLYYDEVDLIWRLRQKGWDCHYVSEAKVFHIEGAATDVRGDEIALRRRPAYWYESRRLFTYKSQGRARGILTAAAVNSGAVLNHLHRRIRGRHPTVPAKFIQDYWHNVFRPLLTGWTPR